VRFGKTYPKGKNPQYEASPTREIDEKDHAIALKKKKFEGHAE